MSAPIEAKPDLIGELLALMPEDKTDAMAAAAVLYAETVIYAGETDADAIDVLRASLERLRDLTAIVTRMH